MGGLPLSPSMHWTNTGGPFRKPAQQTRNMARLERLWNAGPNCRVFPVIFLNSAISMRADEVTDYTGWVRLSSGQQNEGAMPTAE